MSETQWQTNTMISFNPSKQLNYSLSEWNLNNRIRFQSAINLQQSADDLLAKSDQIRDIAIEITKTNKEETDHRLQEKIKDIEYRRNELRYNRDQILEEIKALDTYKNRLANTLICIKKNAINVCKQCLSIRENRIGIDLVHDDVKRELLNEIVAIEGVQNLLEKTLEEAKEKIRTLKSTLYFIDCDLYEKSENIHRNQSNLNLKEKNLDLKSVTKFTCNQANTTLKEWAYQTNKNINECSKEILLSRSLKDNIDSIIKDTITKLVLQQNITDRTFLRRIDETKEQKSKLEVHHAEILEKSKEMAQNVLRLEKLIAEKEGFFALAQTRMNNQCQRSGLENTRDPVQINLVKEIGDLNEIVIKLQQTLFEARSSLRLLLQSQKRLEEDINIKTNTLKIDEVDCMALRQTINYHIY